MIALIQEQFEHNVANHITRFLEHPTAPMIRRFKEYTDLLSFDTNNDWHRWQTTYCFKTIAGSKRAYMTYGGGPEGGVFRLVSTVHGKTWYAWHRDFGHAVELVRIPRELALVGTSEDGYEAVKLVMDDYELRDNEYYLDDMEDSAEEHEESEYGLMNDDDDEANEGRDDDSETEAKDEVEDEADNMRAFMNNERRGEIASLEESIIDYNEQITRASSSEGIATLNMPSIMTLYMLINMAEGRCAELRRNSK